MYTLLDYMMDRVPGVTKIIVASGEKPELAKNQRIVKSLVGNGNKTYWIEEISQVEETSQADDLHILKRPELDKIAEDLGLDPTQYKNMPALRDAILKARQA